VSNIDQQFIEFVVKSLVGNPDAVVVERLIDEKGVLLELTVDPEDLGRVIGKRGATAQSLRTLLRALGTKNDARYNLKIVDNGIGADTAGAGEGERPKPKKAPKKSKPADDTDTADTTPPSKKDDTDEAEAPVEQDETSDRLRKAREELADLDDLDV